MIKSITTSCPDDEALDRRHGRAAVHVAMQKHRQHISLRSATSQPTRRHDVEGPPDVSAVDYNDDEQSWRRHPQLHAPHPSSSRTVASRAQAGTSLYGKNGMLVPAAGARVRNWMAPYSQPARKPTPLQQPDQTEPTPLLGPPEQQTKPTPAPQPAPSQKPEPQQVVYPQPQTKPTPAPEALMSVLVAARSWSTTARSR